MEPRDPRLNLISGLSAVGLIVWVDPTDSRHKRWLDKNVTSDKLTDVEEILASTDFALLIEFCVIAVKPKTTTDITAEATTT